MSDPIELAARLSPNQRELLDDLCRCPGLFAGQYVHDGAGIEHLPRELWFNSYSSNMLAMIGMGKAYPSDLGMLVNEQAQS
jgi:hypothetical protein